MDKPRINDVRYDACYSDNMNIDLRTPSIAEKIQDIREQLEDVLKSAYDKRSKSPPRTMGRTSLMNGQEGSVSYGLPYGDYDSPSQSFRDSRNVFENSSYQNDVVVPADAKLLAYQKFISSLTRIMQDTNQNTPDLLYSLSKNLNIQNTALITQKRPVKEKGTFLIQKNIITDSFAYGNLESYESQSAEKTKNCRPIEYSQELLSKTLEKNARLQHLLKKILQVRQKEKQNETWDNYINELRNKHGHELENRNTLNLYGKENENTRTAYDSYSPKQTWKQPYMCRHVCNDLYGTRYDNFSEERNIQKRWQDLTRKPYKYEQNSFCCPMSSQARQGIMRKQMRGPGYCLRQPMRYFRGSSIIVKKDPLLPKKTFKKTSSKSLVKSCNQCCKMRSHMLSDVYECRAIQTTERDLEKYTEQEPENRFRTSSRKVSKISVIKNKFEQVSSMAEKLKVKLHHVNNKQLTLNKIEDKLDALMASFDTFIKELKTKKVLANVKSAAVSCSSITNKKANVKSTAVSCSSITNKTMSKTKSGTCNVLTKQNIICEFHHQKPHSLFLPRPITQDAVNDILNEEKYKSNQVKKDIDNILNDCQRSVQITVDIPTKDDSTEVTSSFYKRQKEDALVEEIEPIEKDMLEMMERSMTIAVNTDPMGILALIRVSTETVKQILSYVPNLNYVTYLARRQIGPDSAVARYICNICSATFTRPSTLSDHVQAHNIDETKNCCVCRHMLDRFSKRSGLFACAHCGQMFTRAYCREIHEKTCNKAVKSGNAGSKRGARSSLIMLT